MKRKAILIGNTRNLAATPLDLLKAASLLMSNKGGAWNRDEIVYMPDQDACSIIEMINKIRDEKNDYVIVYFTGHGGLQSDTIVEVNPKNELLKENYFFGIAERQLNILDCCRTVQTSPLNIYSSKRGMSPMEMKLRDNVRVEYEDLVMKADPQLVRLYSCSEGESSYPSASGSYYTNNLMECARELLMNDDIVSVHKCHDAASIKTAIEVKRDLKQEQHPAIIPTKCLAQAELPFCFNPVSIK